MTKKMLYCILAAIIAVSMSVVVFASEDNHQDNFSVQALESWTNDKLLDLFAPFSEVINTINQQYASDYWWLVNPNIDTPDGRASIIWTLANMTIAEFEARLREQTDFATWLTAWNTVIKALHYADLHQCEEMQIVDMMSNNFYATNEMMLHLQRRDADAYSLLDAFGIVHHDNDMCVVCAEMNAFVEILPFTLRFRMQTHTQPVVYRVVVSMYSTQRMNPNGQWAYLSIDDVHLRRSRTTGWPGESDHIFILDGWGLLHPLDPGNSPSLTLRTHVRHGMVGFPEFAIHRLYSLFWAHP